MVEFLVAGSVLLLMVFTGIQISFLWAGQGSVDTAAHFAARHDPQPVQRFLELRYGPLTDPASYNFV